MEILIKKVEGFAGGGGKSVHEMWAKGEGRGRGNGAEEGALNLGEGPHRVPSTHFHCIATTHQNENWYVLPMMVEGRYLSIHVTCARNQVNPVSLVRSYLR